MNLSGSIWNGPEWSHSSPGRVGEVETETVERGSKRFEVDVTISGMTKSLHTRRKGWV